MEKEQFELTELGLNIRHWENLRWLSMTVFIAIMGGVAALALGVGGISVSKTISLFVKIYGMFFTTIFWIQDERIVKYWQKYRQRAIVVEANLGVEIFSTSPERGFVSSGTAVRLLYILSFLAWLALLFV